MIKKQLPYLIGALLCGITSIMLMGATSQPPRGEMMPVGAIMAFGGATCPSGWLDADGVAKATATYPALDAYFGTTWGARSGGNFQIPNLNGDGRYLRGGTSPGTLQAQATAKNGLGATFAKSDLNHGHSVTDPSHAHDAGFANASSADGGVGQMVTKGGTSASTIRSYLYVIGAYTGITIGASSSTLSGTETVTLSGDAETRPITAVVRYCIKY